MKLSRILPDSTELAGPIVTLVFGAFLIRLTNFYLQNTTKVIEI